MVPPGQGFTARHRENVDHHRKNTDRSSTFRKRRTARTDADRAGSSLPWPLPGTFGRARRGGANSVMNGDSREDREHRQRWSQLAALLGGFAHEIRNPLSTIGLNLQLVKEDLAGDDSVRGRRNHKRISVIESEVKRLQTILEEFLRVMRRPRLRRRAVNLNQWLGEIVDFSAAELRERGVSLRFFPDDDVGEVSIDPDLLRSVIVNLLRNAKDACRAGDQVMVSTRRQDDQVLIQVTDTGEGMDADVARQAFMPYFSTKSGGSGLGLPIAQRIVREHGGKIELDTAKDKGTQFTVRLPGEVNA